MSPHLGLTVTAFSQFSRRARFTLPSLLSHPARKHRPRLVRVPRDLGFLLLPLSLLRLVSLRLYLHPIATTDSTPRVLLTSSLLPAQCRLPDSTWQQVVWGAEEGRTTVKSKYLCRSEFIISEGAETTPMCCVNTNTHMSFLGKSVKGIK